MKVGEVGRWEYAGMLVCAEPSGLEFHKGVKDGLRACEVYNRTARLSFGSPLLYTVLLNLSCMYVRWSARSRQPDSSILRT